ncbi:MAG TPA: DUF1476 domain-containing protein [Stellaceae bacterium]|nr:DUF1476 domain-containing protein [Stellaceae bacterium]
MSGFDEREKGYERKFQQEQELAFKVKARRNKLLGLWAAERLGLSGEEAQRYAREVLQADLERPGSADIVGKVCADFTKHGVADDEARIRAELERCTTDAKHQLQAGK